MLEIIACSADMAVGWPCPGGAYLDAHEDRRTRPHARDLAHLAGNLRVVSDRHDQHLEVLEVLVVFEQGTPQAPAFHSRTIRPALCNAVPRPRET